MLQEIENIKSDDVEVAELYLSIVAQNMLFEDVVNLLNTQGKYHIKSSKGGKIKLERVYNGSPSGYSY